MATKYVGINGDDGNSGDDPLHAYRHIQKGVDEVFALGGGSVYVAYGTYQENVQVKTNVAVIGVPQAPPAAIVESGSGQDTIPCHDKPTINGGGSGAVVTFDGVQNASISNFWIIDGKAENGGGVSVKGSHSITIDANCIDRNNADKQGGGIYIGDASSVVNVTRNLIRFNKAGRDGGGIAVVDSREVFIVNDNLISLNEAITNLASKQGTGGGILLYQSHIIEITRARLIRNTCDGDGGGLQAYGCDQQTPSVALAAVVFFENKAGHRGGGISTNMQSWLDIDTCNFIHNTAGKDGGAVSITNISGPSGASRQAHLASGEHCKMTQCKLFNNESTESGGGAYVSSASLLILNKCDVLNNTAGRVGGGIHCSYGSAIDLEGCTVSGNTAMLNGGGLELRNSFLNATNTKIRSNRSTTGKGGGIFFWTAHEQTHFALAMGTWGFTRAECNLDAVEMATNIASADGGGLCVEQQHYPIAVRVSGTVVTTNMAQSGNGGGVCLRQVAQARFDATTFENNDCFGATTSLGGGLYAQQCRQVSVAGGTVATNSALGDGGGIDCEQCGAVSITGATFSGNMILNPGGTGTCMAFVSCPGVTAAAMSAANTGTPVACISVR